MFEIDALGTSQGVKGRPQHVSPKLLEHTTANFYVFHATHLISRIENKTSVICFVLCLKLTSWEHSKDINMQT